MMHVMVKSTEACDLFDKIQGKKAVLEAEQIIGEAPQEGTQDKEQIIRE